MQTSRSTRLACSGLLSTSGMRLSATCGRAGRADQARARRASPAAAGRARRAPPARRMLICIFRRQLGAASARAARPARLPPPRFSSPQPPGGQPRGHAGERPAQAGAQRVRACSPVTASRAEQTLLKDPLPSSLTSWYRSPTCAAAHARAWASRHGTVSMQCMHSAAQCRSSRESKESRPADTDTSESRAPAPPTPRRSQSTRPACSCSARRRWSSLPTAALPVGSPVYDSQTSDFRGELPPQMRAWAGLCPTAHGEGAEVAHPAIRTTCMNIPFRPVRAMLQRQRSGKDGYQPIRSSSPERLPRLGRHVSPGPEHTKRPPQQGSIPSRPLDRTQRVNQPTVNRTIAPGQARPGQLGPAARAALRPRCAVAAFVPLVARVTRAYAERGLARCASQPALQQLPHLSCGRLPQVLHTHVRPLTRACAACRSRRPARGRRRSSSRCRRSWRSRPSSWSARCPRAPTRRRPCSRRAPGRRRAARCRALFRSRPAPEDRDRAAVVPGRHGVVVATVSDKWLGAQSLYGGPASIKQP